MNLLFYIERLAFPEIRSILATRSLINNLFRVIHPRAIPLGNRFPDKSVVWTRSTILVVNDARLRTIVGDACDVQTDRSVEHRTEMSTLWSYMRAALSPNCGFIAIRPDVRLAL